MTIFKTYCKVLNKNKWIIIMYTAILLFFGVFNFQNNNNPMNFTESKPDIYIKNDDNNSELSKNLISFLNEKANIISLEEKSLEDALFYRDVNYIIEIPKDYQRDFLNHKNPLIKIRSTGDYQASLAEMLLNRYLNVANRYNQFESDINTLIDQINNTLKDEVIVEMTSKIDNDSLSKIASFYNFSNYSMLAGCIYVICLILTIMKEDKIRKRTIISNTSYKKINRELFIANSLFAFSLAFLYIILSFILLGAEMFTIHGLLFIINFLMFTVVAIAIAFTLGNLIKNKNVINGVINVIALGSSFLCGAFVPIEFLPDSVLKIAHILPSYYFINNNEIIANMEQINLNTLNPFLMNIIILVIFLFSFVVLTNIISRRNQKI